MQKSTSPHIYNVNSRERYRLITQEINRHPPTPLTEVSRAKCLPILSPSCWLIFLPTGPATPVMAATEAGLMTGMASKLTVLVPELKYSHKEFVKIC